MSFDAPIIEFPCEQYPIKVIGDVRPNFQQDVQSCLDVLKVCYAANVQQRDSRAARFLALTFMITAESEAQLKQLNTALRAVQGVRLVL